jgi:hypothetical protein
MKGHKAMLDIVVRIVHLDSPVHGIAILQLMSPSITASSLHHITTPCLKDIPTAHEFPDAFPNDLPGMPLDRDVEFTIELQHGTTLVSRWSYKMTPNEHAKMKI